MKKISIIVISFFIIIGIWCNISKAAWNTTTVYSKADFYGNVLGLSPNTVNGKKNGSTPSQEQWEYWYGQLDGNTKTENGTIRVYINVVDYNEPQEWFNCPENVYWEIYDEVRAKVLGEEVSDDDSSKEVSAWLSQAKRDADGDNDAYIKRIEEKIDTIEYSLANDAMTEEEREDKEYRLSLYKQALEDAKNDKKFEEEVKDQLEEETKDMSLEELQNSREALEAERNTVQNMPEDAVKAKYGKSKSEVIEELNQKIAFYLEKEGSEITGGVPGIYYQPDKVSTGSASGENLDDVINDADDFLGSAIAGGIGTVDQTSLQKFSGTLYNVLLSIGVAVAVIVGALLGIKLMAAGVDEKAEVKNLIIPYVAGCIVVFGGFTIWKIVVEILSAI